MRVRLGPGLWNFFKKLTRGFDVHLGLEITVLEQEWADVFTKSQIIIILGIAGHVVCQNYSTLPL